ncbi:MAG: hypothetical protein AAF465_13530 [Pseudomonadota bacterium]
MNNLNSHRPARRFAGLLTVLGLCFALSAPPAVAGPYDFDDDNKKDMASAFLMCATTGFVLGECPSVFVKCWQPPLIYLKRHRSHFHVRSYCTRLPSWDTSDGAVNDALAYAEANSPEAVAYSAGPQPAEFSLTPQICIDAPYLCPTEEDEAAYEAAEEAAALAQAELEACLENPEADCSELEPGPIDDDLPPICADNPGLCDDALAEDDTSDEDEGDAPDFVHPICEDNPQLCEDVLAGNN